MNINIDSFFKKGTYHKFEDCEDYALSGYYELPHAFLSDGCSSSSNTNIGSRLLCHSAEDVLTTYKDCFIELGGDNIRKFLTDVARNAGDALMSFMNLSNRSLDCTLGGIVVQNEMVYVFLLGDGNIIIAENEGHIVRHRMSYHNNAPFYMSYLLNKEELDWYINNVHYKYRETTFLNDSEGLVYDSTRVYVNGIFWDSYYINDLKSVIITSDGIDSFTNIDVNTIITDLLDFKSPRGQFIKRRADKVISDLERCGNGHYDDISIIGLNTQ